MGMPNGTDFKHYGKSLEEMQEELEETEETKE